MTICDKRFMKDAAPITGAVEALSKTTPLEYRNVELYGMKVAAVPGQDIEAVLPSGVSKDGVGIYSADQSVLVPYLVAAVKELSARLQVLESTGRKKKGA